MFFIKIAITKQDDSYYISAIANSGDKLSSLGSYDYVLLAYSGYPYYTDFVNMDCYVGYEVKFIIDASVVAEIICLTDRALAGNSAICHKSRDISRKHIRVKAILDDKAVFAVGLRTSGNSINSVHNAIDEPAPVSHYHAFFCKSGIIIIDIGQIRAE